MGQLVECVPNFSEGHNQGVIDELRAAIVRVPGTPLLHVQADASHNPFYRLAHAPQTGGTGLGLAITERAVQLHGGTITAANVPGGGLLVTIRLPMLPTLPAAQDVSTVVLQP